jgi:hypothetical protein
MPTVITEDRGINLSRKRSLVQEFMALVASAYDWPLENIILRENENLASGGRLLTDGGRPRCSPPGHRMSLDKNK